MARVLHQAEVQAIETPRALPALTDLRGELGAQVLLGAGSVRTPSDGDSCAEVGIDFLVTPTFSPAVLQRAQHYSLPAVCGALTPTEVDAAWQHGAAAVKLFSAAEAGDVGYPEGTAGRRFPTFR